MQFFFAVVMIVVDGFAMVHVVFVPVEIRLPQGRIDRSANFEELHG